MPLTTEESQHLWQVLNAFLIARDESHLAVSTGTVTDIRQAFRFESQLEEKVHEWLAEHTAPPSALPDVDLPTLGLLAEVDAAVSRLTDQTSALMVDNLPDVRRLLEWAASRLDDAPPPPDTRERYLEIAALGVVALRLLDAEARAEVGTADDEASA